MINSANRVFGLDVLRAFAVLCVVYAHGYFLLGGTVNSTIYKLFIFDGVTFFFVLSGFLIGRILLRTLAKDDFNGKMLIEFWIRRWFRTLPNYFLILIVVVIFFYLLDKPQAENLLPYFFFSQNIASPHPSFFSEAWSLTIEEWFYLIIPIPLYLLSTLLKNINQKRLIPYYIFLVILMVTVFRIYRVHLFNYSTIDDWDLFLRKQVVTRIDSLMFGVLGAYVSLYQKRFWNNGANKLFIVGILLVIFNKALESGYIIDDRLFYLNYFCLTVSPFGTLLLLPKLSLWKESSGRLANVITFVSLTSYSMYLINLTLVQLTILPVVMNFLSRFCWRCGHSMLLTYFLYWIITIGGAFLVYQYFERPMTALRDKWHMPNMTVVKAFIFSGRNYNRKKI
jgi:peptidoglycan/LPS O-acetylase OafA/YrhL